MKLNDFAKTILLGDRLEDKLIELDSELSLEPAGFEDSFVVPHFPGRPLHLSKPGKASFPALHLLHKPEVRGEVLHFFANHELLAMELMALVLLRFPDAPDEFRSGIARTIQEEQSHLKLYLSRMKELGVAFGDLPVSDYFWKTMKQMGSPLDFVVQMSLTFEQANLDFSHFFMNAVRGHGDEKTGQILERVYLEEIGHVKNGLSWFNRWRGEGAAESETDWDAYVRLLPMPMTPRRAKGFESSPEVFSEVRRRAGFSETFIRELSLYSGSKGRPPVIWFYNPHCDSEIVRERPGFTPTDGAKRVSQDLQCVPLFLANEQDTILVQEKPDPEWLESLKQAGFSIPEFSSSIRAPKIGGIEPWGWSPDAFDRFFKELKDRIVEMDGANGSWCTQLLEHGKFSDSELGALFSKSWSSRFLKNWLNENPKTQTFFVESAHSGDVVTDFDLTKEKASEILRLGNRVMLKAPYGTSGMQVRELRKQEELGGPLKGWIENVLESQGELIVEPFLEKTADLSIQLEIGAEKTRIYESRRFINGSRNEYRGTYLGKKQGVYTQEESKFLHEVLDSWQALLRDLAQALRLTGYQGPAGVDALLWRDSQGDLRMKPLVELNPRWTMGRVALELEKRLAPGVSGMWKFLPLREIQAQGFSDAQQYARQMREKYPLQMIKAGGGERIQSGLIFTNDPKKAREVLSVLTTHEQQLT